MAVQISERVLEQSPGGPDSAGNPGSPESPDTPEAAGGPDKGVRRLSRVVIRFAGDSGDGMQLTGDRFTSETASFGNDLSTLPN
ncbi:2-oxoglutarate ferredoxin oxidoreductase subunit alpha, partial [Streptomyces thermocoprophilus]